MQKPALSLHSILEALGLDSACIPLLKETTAYSQMTQAVAPEEVYQAIRSIGETLNLQSEANQLAEDLEERVNIIIHKLKFIPEEHKPKVLCLADVSPMIMVQNEYLSQLISVAGGVNYLNWDKENFNPEILLLIHDKPISELLNELPNALSTSFWENTSAIKNNNIYLIHDTRYLRQPGALIADDTEILAEIINPQYFIFGRNEDAWMPFSLG